MDFWEAIWIVIVSFAFIAYLVVLFSIIADLFRNHQQSGWIKAIWMIALIFVPFLSALVYLIVHGKGMALRSAREYSQIKQAQDDYIRDVAGKSPAEHIAEAKALLDAGTITDTEYQHLKTKALA